MYTNGDCTGTKKIVNLPENTLAKCPNAFLTSDEGEKVNVKWACYGGQDCPTMPTTPCVRLKTLCGVNGIGLAIFETTEIAKMKAGSCFKPIQGTSQNYGSFKFTTATTATYVDACMTVQKAGPKRICDCQHEWDWKGIKYYGCAVTPEDPNMHWCFVEDNSCNVAMVSAEFGETRKFIMCEACDCQRIWEYKGAVYHGCAITSDLDYEWCYTKGYNRPGNTKCLGASNSDSAAEIRKWRKCNSCNCLQFWHYAKEAGQIDPLTGLTPYHRGCGATKDWPGHDWCYVQGFAGKDASPQCGYSKKSEVAGEPRYFRKCDDCNCMRHWNYKGELYGGCAETRDWPNTEWCYVEGGKGCNVASESLDKDKGERRWWRECSACNCMRRWNYQGQYYVGCALTPDMGDTHWCYVQSYQDCKTAQKSQFATEFRWWQKCEGCTCQYTWNYRGAVYHDCATTDDMGETEWCYVQGGPECKDAQASTEPGELRMWRECGNKLTCGIIKQKFKDNKCCGNPTKTFKYNVEMKPKRRLTGSHNELSRDILAQVGAAIRQVKTKGVSAYGLEQEIMSATKRYFDEHVSVV